MSDAKEPTELERRATEALRKRFERESARIDEELLREPPAGPPLGVLKHTAVVEPVWVDEGGPVSPEMVKRLSEEAARRLDDELIRGLYAQPTHEQLTRRCGPGRSHWSDPPMDYRKVEVVERPESDRAFDVTDLVRAVRTAKQKRQPYYLIVPSWYAREVCDQLKLPYDRIADHEPGNSTIKVFPGEWW